MTHRGWHRVVLALAAASAVAACTPAGPQTTGPAPGGPGGGSGGGSGGGGPSLPGTASLSWMPPTQYSDGQALPAAELAAYRIYYGSSVAGLARIAEVDGRTTAFMVRDLATGTHYFAVTSVSSSGTESDFSAVGSKAIP